MAAGDLGLQGLEDVFKNLDRIVKKIEDDGARKALDEQGEALVADVVANTPLVSGAAAGSVRKQGSATPTEVVIEAGGREAPYFPLIEFGGTHNRQPTAPFRQALERRRMVMVKESAETIRAAVPELKE